MKDKIREALSFQDLTPEEKEQRGILGRLYGPCASIIIPTRNGRFYSESLWENQFDNNEILRELIENGGVPMELDHPVDREETCSDRICAMMPELPKRDEDGHLICYVDIIDTPMGKIAYQLAKYGFKLGISSRGTGDLITDENGNEAVDPDSYDLQTFDLVLVPAVKDARLSMTESMQKNKNYNALRQALTESLNSATPEDKKVMEEALKDLGINLNEGVNISNTKGNDNNTTSTVKAVDSNAVNTVANDDGTKQLIKNLTEALKDKASLENQIKELQEQLAVRDSKVNELTSEVDKYKSTTTRLTPLATKSRDLSKENSQLKEQLELKDKQIANLKSRNSKLIEQQNASVSSTQTLNEALNKNESEIKKLTEKLDAQQKSFDAKINAINEENKKKQSELNDKVVSLRESVTKKSKLVEAYKKFATDTIDRYIESKALMLGAQPEEIKNRLPQSYTLNDIDLICEKLQDYTLNISKLPFNLRESKNVRVKINSQEDDLLSNIGATQKDFDADDVDESLIRLAKSY